MNCDICDRNIVRSTCHLKDFAILQDTRPSLPLLRRASPVFYHGQELPGHYRPLRRWIHRHGVMDTGTEPDQDCGPFLREIRSRKNGLLDLWHTDLPVGFEPLRLTRGKCS